MSKKSVIKIDEKQKEIIKKRDEKIARNLMIAKERNRGLEENSLAYILLHNKKIDVPEGRRILNNNKKLKELENKLMENERRIK